MFDDLMNYFSPNETQHRIEVHKEQMEDMEEAEHELLELRRDPHKMKAYHQQEEVRHHKFDMMHDADVEKELSQEWVEGGGFMDNVSIVHFVPIVRIARCHFSMFYYSMHALSQIRKCSPAMLNSLQLKNTFGGKKNQKK
jgi:hypothetical protein